MNTLFASVYNCFLNKITDDMYMELTPAETFRDLQNLLINAIPEFEFPRKVLDYATLLEEYDENMSSTAGFIIETADGKKYNDISFFTSELTSEEINILAILMLKGWLQRQITTIENIRMKYSGTDFKMTSQAAHLGKLLNLQTEIDRQSTHLQRLYKRRRVNSDGSIESNWSVFRDVSVLGGGTIASSGNSSSGGGGSSEEEDEDDEIIYDGGVI